ncbi:hypothetical protein ACFL4G_13410, partial [Thermodesulfobacteriota bacterium]
FLTVTTPDLFIAAGETTVLDLDIRPIPYGVVDVYVTREDNGRAVNRAEVRVRNSWHTYEDKTDRAGYVRFEQVEAEQTYSVRASKFGPAWHSEYVYDVYVEGGVITRVDMEMEHGCFTVAAVEGTALEQELESLRAMRDLMRGTPVGREYIDLYKKHTLEMTWLLLTDARLRSFVREGILAILPEVSGILEDRASVILDPQKAMLLDEIMGEFELVGSRSLRLDIARARLQLQRLSGQDLVEFLYSDSRRFDGDLIRTHLEKKVEPARGIIRLPFAD